MTNERLSNIAITVTAAMLATAAVAFTLSGNAPADPSASDLPTVTIGAPVAHAVAFDSTTTAPGESAAPGGAPVLSPHTGVSGPSGAVAAGSSTSASGAKTPSTGSASALNGGSSASTSIGGGQDDDSDDHEVVVPKVHETEDGKPDETDDPEVDD